MATATSVAPIPYKTPLIDSNKLLTIPWQNWFLQLFDRVGGNSASVLNNPMSGIGDLIYGSSSGSPTRLAGDVSNTRKFLRELSVGGNPSSPVWDTLLATDIPALAYVTSIAMTVPSFLSVSGSPITSNGTLALSLATQVKNTLFAGPSSGSDAAPTFRALVAADIPALTYVTSVALSLPNIFTVSGSPVTSSGTLSAALANQSAGTYLGGPYSGSAAAPTFKSFQARTKQIFTSGTGTYTTPAGVLYLKIRMAAGGGGGSGGSAGGAGGTGGNTTFGTSLLTCNGGTGGNSTGGGAGGSASGGDINFTGPTGAGGSAVVNAAGGSGGNTFFGGGGGGGSGGGAGAAGITNTGSGGGGGGAGGANFPGGGGGAGGYLEAEITSPSASYSYAVGAGGTAGTAGTAAGGAGGSGIIIVEEFYQ